VNELLELRQKITDALERTGRGEFTYIGPLHQVGWREALTWVLREIDRDAGLDAPSISR
jgi:hypothetical protein